MGHEICKFPTKASSDEFVLSQTIDFIRFPLSVAVVLLHCGYESYSGFEDVLTISDYPIFSLLYSFTRLLIRIAVPLFFFISGFLFFYKTTDYSFGIYWEKLKKRTHSLLIPYIIWNSFILIGYLITQTYFSTPSSGSIDDIRNYGIVDFLRVYWDGASGNAPINTALWFIRDLMVLCCFSPLIYFLVKRLNIYYLGILFILWMTDMWFHTVGFSIVSVFFFSAGAYFGIYKKNFIVLLCPNNWRYYLISYLAISCMCLYLRNIDGGGCANIAILMGILCILAICAYFIKKGVWKPNTFLAESSFFIYCYHLSLAFLRKYIVRFLHPDSDFAWIGVYLLFPTIIVLLGLAILYLLKRYCPRIVAVITGGR